MVFKRLFYDPHKKGDEGAEEPGSQASPNTSLTADTVSIVRSSGVPDSHIIYLLFLFFAIPVLVVDLFLLSGFSSGV